MRLGERFIRFDVFTAGDYKTLLEYLLQVTEVYADPINLKHEICHLEP